MCKTIATQNKIDKFCEGGSFEFGSREMEFLQSIPVQDYLSGKIFLSVPTEEKPKPAQKAVPLQPFKSHGVSHIARTAKPLHSPDTPGAFVLYSPNEPQDAKGKPLTPIVVDPFLSSALRPHQKEGVKFMFDCVMGLKKDEISGTGW